MKKILWIIFIVGPIVWFINDMWFSVGVNEKVPQEITVYVAEDGLVVPVTANGTTVEDFLTQTHYALSEDDRVLPPRSVSVLAGMTIEIIRAQKMHVIVDGSAQTCDSYALDVRGILRACGIDYVEDMDEIAPPLKSLVTPKTTITVARVEVKEEEHEISIPFKTVTRTDKSVAFGTAQTIEKGKVGRAILKEHVTYKGGKEVAREEIDRTITVAPKNKVVVTGEKLTLGKKHTGVASWYAYKDCDCAANPWLPKGSYVKVTNRANGKSVVVRINDRGPFVPGRIIDLDVTAFKKIASKGAGVIDVIMEEVKQ